MKNIILSSFAIILIALVSCNGNSEQKSNSAHDMSKMNRDMSNMNHSSVLGNATDEASIESVNFTHNQVVQPIINFYLLLKDSLASDDSKGAAAASENLLVEINIIKINSLPKSKQAEFKSITKNMINNAQEIETNSENISKQREHFALLSNDIGRLVDLLGTPQTLYKDFCPMYNNGKGATWFSETEEIKNPFYGKEMYSCGIVKEVVK